MNSYHAFFRDSRLSQSSPLTIQMISTDIADKLSHDDKHIIINLRSCLIDLQKESFPQFREFIDLCREGDDETLATAIEKNFGIMNAMAVVKNIRDIVAVLVGQDLVIRSSFCDVPRDMSPVDDHQDRFGEYLSLVQN